MAAVGADGSLRFPSYIYLRIWAASFHLSIDKSSSRDDCHLFC